MKRLSLLMFAVVTLASVLAEAQIRLPTFEQLCQYDTRCKSVGRMRRGEFQIKQIKPEQLEYYRRLRATVLRVADIYDIDPVTLVATPLAENTMNVSNVDAVQDFLAENGALDDDGAVAGRPMSIGPGQIYVHAARRVEELAASIEGRPVREKREIKAALLTPEGALRYAAAIIRNSQNVYGAAGKDISKRPEILATLYNIGRPERRLRDSRGRSEPLTNYFGFWVGKQYHTIKTALNLPSNLD